MSNSDVWRESRDCNKQILSLFFLLCVFLYHLYNRVSDFKTRLVITAKQGMDFKVGAEPQKGQVSNGVSVSLTSVTLGYSTSKHYQVVLCSPEPFLMHKPKTFIPTHTHTHPFNGHFSGTAWVSWYQKGKTNLDFTEPRDSGSGISWAICKSAPCSRHNDASTPPLIRGDLNCQESTFPLVGNEVWWIKQLR